MDEIDYNDTALDDFMSRFGDDDPNKNMVQNQYKSRNAIKTSQELEDEKNKQVLGILGNNDGAVNYKQLYDDFGNQNTNAPKKVTGTVSAGPLTEEGIDAGLRPYATNVPHQQIGTAADKLNISSPQGADIPKGESLLATKSMGVGDYATAGMGVFEIAQNAGGKQFDTSADGGGPGKAGGAIMSGAAAGFKAGMATGNPIIAAGGAVVGGLVSTFAHSAAMKKYGKNIIKKNLNENVIERAQNEEEYARSEGLVSMSNLKNLRQKQLGIVNT